MNVQELELYWNELVTEHGSEVIDGFEFDLEDGSILTETRSILLDGFGFVIGETEDEKKVVCEIEYPEISNLASTDLYLISRHLGFEVDRNSVTPEDVASYYGNLEVLEFED